MLARLYLKEQARDGSIYHNPSYVGGIGRKIVHWAKKCETLSEK
jgi:hypothetical protein